MDRTQLIDSLSEALALATKARVANLSTAPIWDINNRVVPRIEEALNEILSELI